MPDRPSGNVAATVVVAPSVAADEPETVAASKPSQSSVPAATPPTERSTRWAFVAVVKPSRWARTAVGAPAAPGVGTAREAAPAQHDVPASQAPQRAAGSGDAQDAEQPATSAGAAYQCSMPSRGSEPTKNSFGFSRAVVGNDGGTGQPCDGEPAPASGAVRGGASARSIR